MDLRKYVIESYPKVDPFEGVNSIEDKLLKYRYLVVIDGENNFHGILTPSDIIEHPHKIVVDCVTKKESLPIDGTIINIVDKFYSNKSSVLPVMNGNDFIGVAEKGQISKALEIKVKEFYDKSLISKKAKEYFLSNLSHEIRTPLNGIIGFLDVITNMDIDNFRREGENISSSIRKSADHFLRIMGDLVDLSLLFAGDEIKIKKSDVDVVKILLELKDFFSELALLQNKKVKIICSTPAPSFSVYTDGERLKHILYHLLENAIKFSQNNEVKYGFEVDSDRNDIVFFVVNEGSQLPQKDKVGIFELFEKQELVGAELNFGLGIGLPLVKKLTELLGGSVKVESKDNEIILLASIPIK